MSKQLLHPMWFLKILANLVGVLGVISLIEFPTYSQTQTPTVATPNLRVLDPGGTVMPNIGTNTMPNIGGIVTYPYGSRVYNGGSVQTPNGQVIPPAVTINHGNGSMSYYYPDGSRIDTNGSTIPPVGTFIK